MRRPLKGTPSITQEFGQMGVDYAQFGLKGHHGCDYRVGIGTPVYAPENGKIEYSQDGVTDKYTGRFAAGEIIVLVGTYEHWLMHLSSRLVKAGRTVKEGQLIGYSGNTGFTTGPHLHWGVRPLKPNLDNGYRGFINPANVLFTKATNAAVQGESMASDTSINQVFEMGLERKPDPGAYTTYRKVSDEVLINSVYGSKERKDKLAAKAKADKAKSDEIAKLKKEVASLKARPMTDIPADSIVLTKETLWEKINHLYGNKE